MEAQEQYAVATRNDPNDSLSLQKVSMGLFKSGLFPGAKNEYGAFAITQYGRELGIGPMMSLKNINIIAGQLAANGQLMLALAMNHGVTFKVNEETDKTVSITFNRSGYQPYTSVFTWSDAEKAKLTDKDNWKKFPKDMLYWRCVSKGLRRIAPDAVMGMYTPDEITSGEIVEVQVDDKIHSGAEWIGDEPNKVEAPAPKPKKQSSKVQKAIAWTLEQGMTCEEIEAEVGTLSEIAEDALPDLKAAYLGWKAGQTEKTSPQSNLEATGANDRDALPGDYVVECSAEKVLTTLGHCRTECQLISNYRNCPDYIGS